ncbi:MAG: molecular chaperone TorD family protein [Coriobacteriales bacterium]|jgi:TorA maturation chaperone TorD|nr:molecular chaperone TorD family protein [Coriobacteriales bacterium]
MSEYYIEIIDVMQGRMATYRFLSRLYRKEVDQELLDQLIAMRYPVKSGNAEMDAGYRMMHGYICSTWERTLTDLAIDFARVFLGHGINAHSAAYPFESVHTSAKRLLMNDARDEVLAIYRANGIEKTNAWREGEDHIALELEFISLLIERTLELLQVKDEEQVFSLLRTQLNFLDNHLLNWVPMLVIEMQKFAKTDFYRALALITSGYLTVDREILEDILAVAKLED